MNDNGTNYVFEPGTSRVSTDGSRRVPAKSPNAKKQEPHDTKSKSTRQRTSKGGDNGTTLQAASLRGDTTTVEWLLNKGADVNARGGGGYGTALQAASSRGHLSTVELLLNKGADVNAPGVGFIGTALQTASLRGKIPTVELLLSKGADVNARGGGGYGTALQAASSKGHTRIVELLLEYDADVNADGGTYGTALQAASNGGYTTIVALLLSKGAEESAPIAPRSAVDTRKNKTKTWLGNLESFTGPYNPLPNHFRSTEVTTAPTTYHQDSIKSTQSTSTKRFGSSESASADSDSLVISEEGDADDPASEVTDYSEDTNQPTGRQSGLSPFLLTFGLRVLRNIASEIQKLFDGSSSNFTYHTDPSTSHGSSQAAQTASSSRAHQQSSFGQKRSGDDDGYKSSDDDRGDGSSKRHKKAASFPLRLALPLRLACPFFKRNPEVHVKWRSCAGPGWDTVHRVKEHVYRRHALPITCTRCGEIYGDEEALKKHSRDPVPCSVGEVVEEHGYSKEQERQLKSRKRTQGQTQPEKWTEMYRILFPEDCEASIPSPFYESDERIDHKRLAKFAQYLKDELPKKMQADMQSDLAILPEWFRAPLQGRIGEIARICTEKVLEEYQKPNPSPPQTPVATDHSTSENRMLSENSSSAMRRIDSESESGSRVIDVFGVGESESGNDDHFPDVLSYLPPIDFSEWNFDPSCP